MRRAILVGAIVRDTVRLADGGRREGLGGLTFAVEALAALAPEDVEIIPVCPVGAGLDAELRRRWSVLGRVRLDRLRSHDAPDPTVILDYREPGLVPGERTERLLDPLPALEAADLRDLPAADAALVNCVAGDDLTEAALLRVAEATPFVHLDLHSRLLDRLPDGRRRPRRPGDWRRWLRPVDLLQCNLVEAATLTGAAAEGGGPDDPPPAVVELGELLAGADDLPPWAVVTAAAAGAWLLGSDGLRRLPAPDVEVVDPTGAGDTFGAALLAGRLRGLSVPAAAAWAVAVASASCALQGTEELHRLPAVAPGAPETATGSSS